MLWRQTRSFERDDLQVRSRSRRTWRRESVIRRTVTGPVSLPVDWRVGPNQAADRDVAPFTCQSDNSSRQVLRRVHIRERPGGLPTPGLSCSLLAALERHERAGKPEGNRLSGL